MAWYMHKRHPVSPAGKDSIWFTPPPKPDRHTVLCHTVLLYCTIHETILVLLSRLE